MHDTGTINFTQFTFSKKLHTQIKALAQANNLDFAQATMMLLTSGIQDPKLVLPKNRSDQ